MVGSLMSRKLLFAWSCFFVSIVNVAYAADESSNVEEVQLEEMVIKASKPAVPANVPATSEGLTATQIAETVNAVSSGEVLKYLPSIHVRERFSGDVNGGLAMRMYGVNSSADTLVYADGLVLSSLLNNSCCPGPKWGMVSPEEIERVDAIYGPFSAMYPGNSIGGVLLMTTHMPSKFEAHAKVDWLSETFKLNGTNNNFNGVHGAANLGSKVDKFSFWLSGDHLDNHSHPTDFTAATEFTGTAPTTGFTDVTGAVIDIDKSNKVRVNTHAISMDHTVKDEAKIKLAYDFSPTVRATYTLGVWQNTSDKTIDSYLRDAAGNTIYGTDPSAAATTAGYKYVRINGKFYTVTAPAVSNQVTENYLQGLSVKSNTGGKWDWEAAASLYTTSKDVTHTSVGNWGKTPSTDATKGTLTLADGTGWDNLDLRGEWRSSGDRTSKHQVSFGYHDDNYVTKTDTYDVVNWLSSASGTLKTNARGKTETQAVYMQDAVQLSPTLKLVAGGRMEDWKASDGSNYAASTNVTYKGRTASAFSPKVALSLQPNPDWSLRGSYGKATRFPTVGELFKNIGISVNGVNATATQLGTLPLAYQTTNDPNLKPESADSWELTAERFLENGVVRASLFGEEKRDALISQNDTTTLPGINPTLYAGYAISSVQNIDKVRSYGLETSMQLKDKLIRGLDLSGNVTYVNSKIVSDAKNPLLENTLQPLVPVWRAALVGTYHASDKLSYTVGYRYSGRQHSGLFNTATMQYDDPNPNTYGGRSTFQVLDAKVLYKFAKQWSASVGVNNIANEKYYTLYPYAQRNYLVGVKYDN
jgi:iron complex outermembrane recepter protein